MVKTVTRFLALAAAVACSGCGSIMNRGPQAISIEVDPAGSECTVDGVVFKAPAKAHLSTLHNYTVSCRREGYETSFMFVGSRLSGWIWGNSIMPWLFFGTAYDYNSDSAHYFDPGTVHMRLIKR